MPSSRENCGPPLGPGARVKRTNIYFAWGTGGRGRTAITNSRHICEAIRAEVLGNRFGRRVRDDMTTHNQNLPRVFFDPSEGPDNVRYALWLPQSLIDLDRIGVELRDGMRIIICADDGRELLATLVLQTAVVTVGLRDRLVPNWQNRQRGTREKIGT